MATYTTKSGDMWDSIAHTQLGSVRYTGKLMALNQKHRNIFIFPAGIELTLPEREDSISSFLPPWKRRDDA